LVSLDEEKRSEGSDAGWGCCDSAGPVLSRPSPTALSLTM
jgi:hypothetical protein